MLIKSSLILIKAKISLMSTYNRAGISVQSGIPSFRGEDGLWTVGNKNYIAIHGRLDQMT